MAPHAQAVKNRSSIYKILYVAEVQDILNPEGLKNLIIAGPKRGQPTQGFSIFVRTFVCPFVRSSVRPSPLCAKDSYIAILALQILNLL